MPAILFSQCGMAIVPLWYLPFNSTLRIYKSEIKNYDDENSLQSFGLLLFALLCFPLFPILSDIHEGAAASGRAILGRFCQS